MAFANADSFSPPAPLSSFFPKPFPASMHGPATLAGDRAQTAAGRGAPSSGPSAANARREGLPRPPGADASRIDRPAPSRASERLDALAEVAPVSPVPSRRGAASRRASCADECLVYLCLRGAFSRSRFGSVATCSRYGGAQRQIEARALHGGLAMARLGSKRLHGGAAGRGGRARHRPEIFCASHRQIDHELVPASETLSKLPRKLRRAPPRGVHGLAPRCVRPEPGAERPGQGRWHARPGALSGAPTGSMGSLM